MSFTVLGGATITPNTLNAITRVFALSAATDVRCWSHIRYVSHISHLQVISNGHRITLAAHQHRALTHGTEYSNTANNAANTAANGPFLLSQAHQEFTKREEAQHSNCWDSDDSSPSSPSNAASKRGMKRKSYDVSVSAVSSLPHHPCSSQAYAVSQSVATSSQLKKTRKKGGQRKFERGGKAAEFFQQGTWTEALPHCSSLHMHFDSSGAEMSSTEKGLVDPMGLLQVKNEYFTQ